MNTEDQTRKRIAQMRANNASNDPSQRRDISVKKKLFGFMGSHGGLLITLRRLLTRRTFLVSGRTPAQVIEFINAGGRLKNDDYHGTVRAVTMIQVMRRNPETGEPVLDSTGAPEMVKVPRQRDVPDSPAILGSLVRRIAIRCGLPQKALFQYEESELRRLCAAVADSLDALVPKEGEPLTREHETAMRQNERRPDFPDGWETSKAAAQKWGRR